MPKYTDFELDMQRTLYRPPEDDCPGTSCETSISCGHCGSIYNDDCNQIK